MAGIDVPAKGWRIRKVGPDEVGDLHAILRECGQDMKRRLGLSHWDPPYPLHLFQKEAETRDVYAVISGDQTVATFTVGTEPPSYFDFTEWSDLDARAMYVNHLAVIPGLQGGGTGTWCMKTIERMARDGGCQSVRLDAYEEHKELLKFYERLEYSRRGIWTFRGARQVCFEKAIARQ